MFGARNCLLGAQVIEDALADLDIVIVQRHSTLHSDASDHNPALISTLFDRAQFTSSNSAELDLQADLLCAA